MLASQVHKAQVHASPQPPCSRLPADTQCMCVDVVVQGVLCELFGEGAEAVLQGQDHLAAIHTAAAAAAGQVMWGVCCMGCLGVVR